MLLAVTACAAAATQISTPTSLPAGPQVRGVFQGNTPCSSLTRPLPQIPEDADCDQVIWKLALYQDPVTGAPTNYRLNSAYGLSKQGTNGLIGGGTAIAMEGRWGITTGTKPDPEAEIYQLNPGDPGSAVSFVKMSDDLLHVLSSDKTLLVGNGAWSYTQNRMDERIPAEGSEPPGSPPEPPARPPPPPMPAGSSVFGVFDGRTPCHAIVLEFTGTAPFPGCTKVKWRLTLYQDEATGAPSTYLFMGTSHFRTGTWTIRGGTERDPETVIYQLQPEGSKEPVSFLQVDENHLFLLDRSLDFLVGNELFSYTLSRVGDH